MTLLKNLVYFSTLTVAVNGWTLDWDSPSGDTTNESGSGPADCKTIELNIGSEYAWDPEDSTNCLGLYSDTKCQTRIGFSCASWGPRNTGQNVKAFRVFDTPEEDGGDDDSTTTITEGTTTTTATGDETTTTDGNTSATGTTGTDTTDTTDTTEPTDTTTGTDTVTLTGTFTSFPTGIPTNGTVTGTGPTGSGTATETDGSEPTDDPSGTDPEGGDQPSGTGEEPPQNSDDNAAGLSMTISTACVAAAVIAAFGFLA